MEVEYRVIEPDELDAYLEADRLGFASPPREPGKPDSWARGELDRAFGAFAGGAIVGVGRNYSFELTVPGPACVPAGAVSWISVLPTHRRRGVLTGMLRTLHADARDRDEVAAMLTASESVIYGRFGYGPATWRLGCSVERVHGHFAHPVHDPGRLRFLDESAALRTFPAVYDAVRRSRAGMVSRPDFWWPEVWSGFSIENGALFAVVHEDAAGAADGYAFYSVGGDWAGGVTAKKLTAWDVMAPTPAVRAALWRYLLDVDLVHTVSAVNVPVDEPLRFLLADPRRLRVDYVNDGLWLRPLDPAALLAARRYASPGTLVLEVHEPDGTVQRLALDGGPDGAACTRATAEPDLVLGLAQLGAVALGGTPWRSLADAGLIEERRGGSLTRADAMFATHPAPATLSWF